MAESIEARSARAGRIAPVLAELYPDLAISLDWETPLQLLVATILSAQCTDERVNMTTPALFARFPDARAYAEADRDELEDLVRSTGFYRNKAKHIQQMAARLFECLCRFLLDDGVENLPVLVDKFLDVFAV